MFLVSALLFWWLSEDLTSGLDLRTETLRCPSMIFKNHCLSLVGGPPCLFTFGWCAGFLGASQFGSQMVWTLGLIHLDHRTPGPNVLRVLKWFCIQPAEEKLELSLSCWELLGSGSPWFWPNFSMPCPELRQVLLVLRSALVQFLSTDSTLQLLLERLQTVCCDED